jgi:hypothetical protein
MDRLAGLRFPQFSTSKPRSQTLILIGLGLCSYFSGCQTGRREGYVGLRLAEA